MLWWCRAGLCGAVVSEDSREGWTGCACLSHAPSLNSLQLYSVQPGLSF